MEIAVKNEKILDSPTDGTGGGGGSSDTGSGAELQKQQSLEKSINSHHHDSEYDTASDLEDYSEDGESGGAEDKENGSSTGSDFDDDVEGEEDDDEEQNEDDENKKKVDYTKKVDEDRSNPQYIPKKGTFYEHDDRTADDPSSVLQISDKTIDGESNAKATNNAPVSTNSASKTMKQWQPASAMDRWSHDRYDENEQAPKSRSELVSAYGYDIRSEDGPPHARRKRHYGRGPSKYNRKWEDESAYIKSNNNQRKPPRPEDFPSLGDKNSQKRDQRSSRSKEEKENRYENREPKGDRNDRSDRKRDNYRRNDRDRRINKNYNGHKTVEFKNRNRSNNNSFDNQRKSQNSNDLHEKSQVETLSFTNTKVSNNPTSTTNANIKLSPPQHQSNERYNGHSTISNEQNIDNKISNNTNYKLPQLQQSQQPKLQNAMQTTSSQLSARLQQVASNAPSHVGSVQMHSLATQPGTQSQALVSPIDIHQQHQEPGRPKRYSSLRSRQNDQVMPAQPSGNIEPHANATLQQLQQYEVNSQQRQQVLLQANLMQLYQENIQAHQMQGVVPIQTLQQPQTQQKPPSQFQNPPPSYQNTAGAAYYTQPPPPAAAADYSYLPQQQPSVVTAGPPQIPYHAAPAANPATYVQTQAAPNPVPAGPAPAAAPYPNYPQTTAQPQPYQPYNTVGGTTYFVGHTQPAPRTTTTLPQRRPTNAIPILAPPSDKNKANNIQSDKDSGNITINDVESIDHILDNMFVQRQYQPQQIQPAGNAAPTITAVNSNILSNTDSSVANLADTKKIEDAMKNVAINDVTTAPTESITETAENSPPQTQS